MTKYCGSMTNVFTVPGAYCVLRLTLINEITCPNSYCVEFCGVMMLATDVWHFYVSEFS